jgi:hypothetical protein
MEERRSAVRRLPAALILAGLSTGAAACQLPGGTHLSGARVAASFRTLPAQLAAHQPFVVEFLACPDGEVRVDAHMPEHRHGMNYRPGMAALGGGRYLSEGWLFHMPGRWEFVFHVGGERLAHSVEVR